VNPPYESRNDQDLVAALNDGDASAFDALYLRYRDWVVCLAERFTRNDADALDVLQETWAYVIRKFPGFRLTASFTTFLYPVVKNLSIAARRKRGRFAGDELALDAAPATDPRPDGPGELATVLAALPDTHRDVLLLRFVDGLSLEEVADALDIPVGTVKSRIHNAIKLLRDDERTRNYFSPQ
jgi:RNA polymerase sigma-70 factor, ECF subfamily